MMEMMTVIEGDDESDARSRSERKKMDSHCWTDEASRKSASVAD